MQSLFSRGCLAYPRTSREASEAAVEGGGRPVDAIYDGRPGGLVGFLKPAYVDFCFQICFYRFQRGKGRGRER